MESFPVDIDPGQVVRWVKAELEAAPASLRVSGRRTQATEVLRAGEAHLGDDEREDLSEVDTVVTLEIAPVHVSEGWTLSVVVEDEIGPRMDDVGDEQAIDLGTFYKQFIRPGRGTANVVAEVRDATAKVHIERPIEAIETNRHAGSRKAPAR